MKYQIQTVNGKVFKTFSRVIDAYEHLKKLGYQTPNYIQEGWTNSQVSGLQVWMHFTKHAKDRVRSLWLVGKKY
jgi:hypothetical protein